MIKSKFYINFKSRPDLNRIQFKAEPVGFDAADFSIVQEDGRMGVDTLFAGGTGKFQFSKMAHPEIFEHLQNTIDIQGFEAVADLEIDYNSTGNIIIIGNLDFFTSDNNTYGLIAIDVILGEEFTKIKKNIEANVNIFSSLDLGGNAIQPVQAKDVMLLSKPIFSTSVWESPEGAFTLSQGGNLSNPPFFNKVKNLTVSGINDSLTWFEDYVDEDNNTFRSNFRVIRAATTLTDVNVVIDKDLKSEWSAQPPFDNNIQIKGVIFVGTPENWYNDYMNNQNVFYNVGIGASSPTATDNGTYTINLGTIETGKVIFFAFVHGSQGNDIAKTTYGNTKLTITASAVNYDTVNKGVRLIDAVKQVAKSAGMADVSFPMAEQNGYLYNQFLFNGNLLRNITDKPFNISWKQITEWFPEQHLDYEIQADGSILISNDEGFIRNSEMYVCDKMADIGLKDNFNPEFGLNLYSFNFQNYQSQKENDTANTYDEVHGETQWKSPNINVTGSKEIKINFIRSPFSLENVRVKSFSKNENSATQDDEKIYIVDIFPKSRIQQQFFQKTKTDLLQHYLNLETQRLTLRNSGNFNWLLLGIKVGYSFRITSTPNLQVNQGSYTVVEVASNYLVLMLTNGTFFSDLGNGERYTNFQYFIPVSSLEGVTWTNQDFTQIEGILNPESFGNLRFTPTRLTLENWGHHLATASFYHPNKAFINTLYKNNPNLITTIYGVTVKEGENFIPKNPLLSPKLVTVVFKMSFDKYYELMNKVRSPERGFIRVFDAFGNPIKLYIKDMRFKQTSSSLGDVTLIGKKKHEPSILNIDTNQGENFISLNNNEYLVQSLRYEIKDNYFYIKDQNGRLIYKRLTFRDIAFNGTLAETQSQLINWLNPISEQ